MFDKITITIQRHYLSEVPPKPSDSSLNNGDSNSVLVEYPRMENSIEVFSDHFDGQSMTLDGFTVLGTIMRKVEKESADSDSMNSTNLELEHPVFQRRNTLPEVDINLIKQWIQFCNVHHDRCHLPTLGLARDHRIRLIDVQEYKIISNTLVEKYVALSYVWGPGLNSSLTQDTLSQYSSPGGLKGLMIPRTISDAIQLVKHIGKRFLWVDSLCIKQDDDNDRKQQLGIMDSIYTNAEFIIVAAAGGDANAGLPGIGGTPRRISQMIEKLDGIEFTTTQASVQQALNRTVWNRRGWTFQEAILSRRALVFTESLVYWCYQSHTWREEMSGESSVVGLNFSETNTLWPHRSRTTVTCRTFLYCQLAQNFSQRAFKEERDVIWAFIGILRLQRSRFQKGFIWALPYERLDAALLWSDGGCPNLHTRRARHSIFTKGTLYDLPYPSWSWLSTDTGISYIDPCGASVVSEVIWHAPLKLGDHTSTTYLKLVSLEGVADDHGKCIIADFLAESTSESDIMDYGLLHFTAQTVLLTLRQGEKAHKARNMSEAIADGYKLEDCWVVATLHSFEGKQVGMLRVPLPYFDKKSERAGEFVLLSSNAEKKRDERCKEASKEEYDCGTFNHVRGCSHIRSLNIMLIKWDGNIAYRRALGVVKKENWKDIKTQSKTIILG